MRAAATCSYVQSCALDCSFNTAARALVECGKPHHHCAGIALALSAQSIPCWKRSQAWQHRRPLLHQPWDVPWSWVL